MKNAAIFHGRNCSPDMFWYEDIKNHLEKQGYQVWLPQLPNTYEAALSDWLPFAKGNFQLSTETILVGVSAGANLILSLLEQTSVQVRAAVLVAASSNDTILGEKRAIVPQRPYRWSKIAPAAREFFIINSNDDPYECTDDKGREIFNKIGGVQIIAHGQGHFGSIKFKQDYPEFPLLKRILTDL